MFNRLKQTTMNRIRYILLAAFAVVGLATAAQKTIITILLFGTFMVVLNQMVTPNMTAAVMIIATVLFNSFFHSTITIKR